MTKNNNRWDAFGFLHIEKTGGITLHNILHQNFISYITPSPEFGNALTSKDLKKIQKSFPLKIKGFGSHRLNPTEDYSSLFENLFLFTFIRQPINRYLSHFNYGINEMGMKWDFKDFIEYPYFNNYQCFRISGKRDFNSARKIIDSKFNFVGLLEEFDASLQILKKELGLKNINYTTSNKTRINTSNIVFDTQPEHIKSIIKTNNQMDIDLYSYVKENIFLRHQEKWLDMEPMLEDFKRSNENYSFSPSTKLKTKMSNSYLRYLVQPFVQSKADDSIQLEKPIL